MPTTKKKSNRNRRQSSSKNRTATPAKQQQQQPQQDRVAETRDRERMDDDGGLEGEPASRSGRSSST